MLHFPSLQQPSPEADFPLAMVWPLCAAMSHLPSLQQSSPQHAFPAAILPSFIMGHLSPVQHAQVFVLSPAAGAADVAGVAVWAIIASANSIVNSATNTFVFMISSNLFWKRELLPVKRSRIRES